MLCQKCGSNIANNCCYCPYCGEKAKRELRCCRCGAPLQAGQRFCSMCGLAVNADAQNGNPLYESAPKDNQLQAMPNNQNPCYQDDRTRRQNAPQASDCMPNNVNAAFGNMHGMNALFDGSPQNNGYNRNQSSEKYRKLLCAKEASKALKKYGY